MAMAGNVQQHMERMLAELALYKKHGVFDEQEIKSIVDKRREFEYSVASPNRAMVDFLKYIEYEIVLDRIREKRMKKTKARAPGLPTSIRSRIDRLFRRALSRYPTDQMLWRQYLEYFKSVGDRRRSIEIALRLPAKFPKSEELWIDSARLITELGDIGSARVLLQRAARLVRDKKRILLEFLCLEIDHLLGQGQGQEQGQGGAPGDAMSVSSILIAELCRQGLSDADVSCITEKCGGSSALVPLIELLPK